MWDVSRDYKGCSRFGRIGARLSLPEISKSCLGDSGRQEIPPQQLEDAVKFPKSFAQLHTRAQLKPRYCKIRSEL